MLRKRASRRGRAGIVDRPIDDRARSGVLANVFRRDHVAIVRRSDPRTINTRAKSRGSDAIDPGVNVGLLFRQHAAALLLVEKNNDRAWKSLAPCSRSGSLRVRSPEASCVCAGFQLGVEPPVEEHKKSESGGLDGGAMTGPSVGRRSRRIVQPVSGVRKRLMKSLEISIARITIAVEAEVGMGRILAVGKSPDNPYKRNRHR